MGGMTASPDHSPVYGQGVTVSDRGQWPIPHEISFVSKGSKRFERLEQLERFEPNSQEAYSSALHLVAIFSGHE
jgi:hypothetical protein